MESLSSLMQIEQDIFRFYSLFVVKYFILSYFQDKIQFLLTKLNGPVYLNKMLVDHGITPYTTIIDTHIQHIYNGLILFLFFTQLRNINKVQEVIINKCDIIQKVNKYKCYDENEHLKLFNSFDEMKNYISTCLHKYNLTYSYSKLYL